ncbi:MAG TPA: sugar-transfer associated ATP-grasp domain-containing protein, partial [Gemmatimonadaceae bacterium]|nr:sugar-transfer associated ATP-grasp domain-containing protein [Gemmatimonadaceae bacterium]
AVGLPIPREREAAALRIQRLARRFRRAELAQKRGPLWAMKATLVAPARATREALHAVRAYGAAAAEDTGVSRLRQGLWMWWLNLRHDFTGTEAYRYRLFSRDRVLPRPLFLQWEEAALLYRTVIPRTSLEAARILADKRRFAAWCVEQQLPTAPILMEFADGRLTRRQLPEGHVPATDLFSKWGTQYGGDDTQRWRYDEGRWLDDEGRGWTFDELVASLTERSRDGVVLLQPRLVNHPALRPLSPNALSTIRVMTVRRPGGPARLLAGVLRMGTGASTADNFAQGGIASPVDAATGTLGDARRIDKQQRTHAYRAHPDTGAAITGYRVPFWEESVRLALDAHTRLGAIPCVGWDVAVLDDGPVLLEGNWNACTKLLQVATQTPLLATEFADTFAAWLDEPECAVDDRWLVEHARWSPV